MQRHPRFFVACFCTHKPRVMLMCSSVDGYTLCPAVAACVLGVFETKTTRAVWCEMRLDVVFGHGRSFCTHFSASDAFVLRCGFFLQPVRREEKTRLLQEAYLTSSRGNIGSRPHVPCQYIGLFVLCPLFSTQCWRGICSSPLLSFVVAVVDACRYSLLLLFRVWNMPGCHACSPHERQTMTGGVVCFWVPKIPFFSSLAFVLQAIFLVSSWVSSDSSADVG